MMDEIFGRKNRVSIITFKQSSASGPKSVNPGIVTTNNFILYYVRDREHWEPGKVYVPIGRDDRYSKFIKNIHLDFDRWEIVSLREAFLASERLASWDDAQRKFNVRLESKLEAFVLAN